MIKELANHLERLGIAINRPTVYRNREPLLAAIEELLLGVTLALNNPNVETCTFERISDSDPDAFCFVIKTYGVPGATIAIPSNVRIACPVFSPDRKVVRPGLVGDSDLPRPQH